jgi:hypothetical protein
VAWPGADGTAAQVTRLIRLKPGGDLALYLQAKGQPRVLELEEATVQR